MGCLLGDAECRCYLSHAKANSNGTKPAATTMMMTRAPASDVMLEAGACVFIRSGNGLAGEVPKVG